MYDPRCLTGQSFCLGSFSSIIVFLSAISVAGGEESLKFREQPDPVNVMHSADLADGDVVQYSSQPLLDSAIVDQLNPLSADQTVKKSEAIGNSGAFSESGELEKIHPELSSRISARVTSGEGLPETETVVVTFKSDVQMPRFPEPDIDQRSTSTFNRAARNRALEIVDDISLARFEAQETLAADLADRHEADVLDRFWLSNSLLVTLPAAEISALAERDDVLYVEPELTAAPPPADGNDLNDVDDGRAIMASDLYYNLPNLRSGGSIGLLDTGVRASHVQFNNPDPIFLQLDCTDGICDQAPNPDDDCWDHGTSSAAIITGNSRLGNPFRGVTAGTLNSYKVYPAGCGGLSTSAVLAGFQRSVAALDSVIVAEMQGGGNARSAISIAADNAFDAGAVIIAANGNNGPGQGTVNTPANSHKTIGVGNFDVQTQDQVASQSRGPAPDGRIKPDIQAPTNTETASSASATALRVFSGTSGATPYAAGAAFLARNFLRGTSATIDPGQVYSFLILAGQNPFPFDDTSGAGPIELPTRGGAFWGKVSVGAGQTINIPLQNDDTNAIVLDGAIWWPESAEQAHNDIDLQIVAQNGSTVLSSSLSELGVFERARVVGGISPGTFTLRIIGLDVSSGPQEVYYAAHIR